MSLKNKSELMFENEVINYLCNIGGVKQWEYLSSIKTSDDLWLNFKNILENNNKSRLNKPLSKTEFEQVKKVITDLDTPYKAGQFLYGINGVSEVLVELDDGESVFLTVFDQDQIGAGNTVYQIVNQITRPSIIDGKQNRRFDITMLINGLPIIQIELKKAMHSTNESLNQMEQYIAERQYSDVFSTLQILVAMTPHEIRYMANTTKNAFNKAFAFQWQTEKNSYPIISWKEFCDLVLSIPMAHELATRYMILDGTKNKESIKVMRPYQVYATRKVLDKVKLHDFKYGDGKLGYIWHTTGSGKTITSFKTAWLASRLPSVDKVIFLVDRIALTNQTSDAYKAYDPTTGGDGIVDDTASIKELHKKYKIKSSQNIIVTSIQKMSLLVNRKEFNNLNQNVLFVVDEAHRSTGDVKDNTGMLMRIREAIPTAGWVGYTGTPKFPATKDIFGELLHAYTIKEAISDCNVLGFKVEFKETIKPPENPTEDDIDDNIKASVYDLKHEHVELVVEDVLKNWDSRSSGRLYNALFTVHVGGTRTSRPRVMEYYHEFLKQMENLPPSERLKIGVSFSEVTNNADYQAEANEDLHTVIKDYNKMFNTNFDMSTVKEYIEDLTSRLNKTALDCRYLDLVIVIDQLLTGFDAPELNTLYIDRTLKGSNLIQAYSRTNRLHNRDKKPHGNIVNYRWPEQNEYAMNEAFAIYSNRESAYEQLSMEDLKEINTNAGILAKDYNFIVEDLSKVVKEIREFTHDFKTVP
ncbi:MAG: HsdR family type I site-specific deoxyribonuclease, partial [Bacilli bacterium]|nr:HsdR family type I site-specific deoxyribonuclease [Bacilli bacterium]